MRRLLRRPGALLSATFLLLVCVAAAAADLLAPYTADFVDLPAVLAPPSGAHPMGGDGSGRDVLSRLLFGARDTLIGALLATAVALVVGVTAGMFAGYFARWVDAVASWVFSLMMALPAIIVVLAFVAVVGPGLVRMMAFVGFLASPSIYRLVRAVTQRVRGELYIDAAKVSGLSHLRIVRRHVLSVVRSAVVVQAPLLFGAAILIQAGIDFLGLGEPGAASWGAMLNDAATNVFTAPWLSIWPGAAIALTVLAVNLLGNAVRDDLEPPQPRAAAPRTSAPPAPSVDALLTITDLTVAHGPVTVVDRVSLAVRPGEVLGLVGESGSGKTQTVLAALGLLPGTGRITAGGVVFDGAELTGLPERALNRLRGRRIGYVSQEPMSNLDPSFRVGSQLIEPIVVHLGLSRREARQRALSLLARVGIADPARIYRSFPHEISGGTAQRVLIAAAVSCDPDLLIADEPTTALDVTVQAEVLDLLRSLQRERGMAVLIVTHDLGVVADMCDRVAVMRNGRLVETAPVGRLFASPAEPYTAALLAANPHNAAPRRPRLGLVSGPGRALELGRSGAGDGADAGRGDATLAGAVNGLRQAGRPQVAAEPEDAFRAESGDVVPSGGFARPRVIEGPRNATAPLLEVDRLCVDFPQRGRRTPPLRVLREVSLALTAGETLGLVGESGSGKTTLGRAVLGLAPVTSGSIRFDGRPLAPRRARARDVQAVFQDPYSSLNPAMRIHDILVEPLLVTAEHTAADADKRIRSLLDRVGLPAGTGERRARELSGGQRQRVAIARALALGPRLIICDEPVSALDVSTQAQVLDLLVEIQRDTGVAYLFISHDLAVVRHISDRVAVMSQGRIVEIGDAEQVTTDPRDPYTRRLLLSALVPDPEEQAARRAARLAMFPSST
ncbi:dipeptide ABC transporter ATP-binding protein [Nonomuraea sp. NPDC003804]|uniref:dipeptide ABC transporter ATP-binding protein n=1 Tax=Nonomuraea sp. NPDC003804 TaxID=3154547 RepID=UPI0033B8D782